MVCEEVSFVCWLKKRWSLKERWWIPEEKVVCIMKVDDIVNVLVCMFIYKWLRNINVQKNILNTLVLWSIIISHVSSQTIHQRRSATEIYGSASSSSAVSSSKWRKMKRKWLWSLIMNVLPGKSDKSGSLTKQGCFIDGCRGQ